VSLFDPFHVRSVNRFRSELAVDSLYSRARGEDGLVGVALAHHLQATG